MRSEIQPARVFDVVRIAVLLLHCPALLILVGGALLADIPSRFVFPFACALLLVHGGCAFRDVRQAAVVCEVKSSDDRRRT